MSAEWVTDPDAIKTLVELGGLQVGDEVKLKDSWCIFLASHYDDCVWSIAEAPVPGMPDHTWREHPRGTRTAKPVVAQLDDENSSVIALENIAAWRRP